METICITCSIKYKDLIRDTIQRFKELAIEALYPNLDSGLYDVKEDPDTVKKLCQDHFEAINRSEALYVIDPKGSIGTLATVKIGYALGKGKPVYFSEKTDSIKYNSLCKDIIPLTEIESFKSL